MKREEKLVRIFENDPEKIEQWIKETKVRPYKILDLPKHRKAVFFLTEKQEET